MLGNHLPRDLLQRDLVTWAALYRKVFSGPDGQRVLDHILQVVCGLNAPIVVEKDEMATVVRAARHDIGAQILRLVYAPIDDTKPTVRR